jgi:hypothetical protein
MERIAPMLLPMLLPLLRRYQVSFAIANSDGGSDRFR